MAFTGQEEIFNGYNRKLFFTTTMNNALPADEAAIDPEVKPVWNEIGYDDGFSFNENENEAQKFNKRTKSHKKKGRKEYTFDISHLYAGADMSIFMLKGKEGTFKQVTENDAGEIVEVNYFHKAYINSPQFNGGGDDGDDTVSATGDYSDRFLYDSQESAAVLLYATDGSHETP
jgi:hypothetical protein